MADEEFDSPEETPEATAEELVQELRDKQDELTQLRAEREARQQADADKIRAAQLRAEIGRVEAEIAQERSVVEQTTFTPETEVETPNPNDPEVIANGPSPALEPVLQAPEVDADVPVEFGPNTEVPEVAPVPPTEATSEDNVPASGSEEPPQAPDTVTEAPAEVEDIPTTPEGSEN